MKYKDKKDAIEVIVTKPQPKKEDVKDENIDMKKETLIDHQHGIMDMEKMKVMKHPIFSKTNPVKAVLKFLNIRKTYLTDFVMNVSLLLLLKKTLLFQTNMNVKLARTDLKQKLNSKSTSIVI